MTRLIEISISPELAGNEAEIRQALKKAGLQAGEPYNLVKRSIDARKKPPIFVLRYAVGENRAVASPTPRANNVRNAREVHIIGAGPCGLFAAVRCVELGLKPILIERGKNVKDRRRDLARINREHIVNPESNYCFGEGGAGTYSDGKLYTRSKKRGSVERILAYLVAFGANPDILIDAHPHIGTNKLPALIENIRKFILDCGGEIWFDTKLTDIEISGGRIKSIELNGNEKHNCHHLILATGHSARDIFELLHKRNIKIEAKPFALGVRIEHPQALIDKIQYHCTGRGEFLPPSSYSLVQQVKDRGVYSFCMCPGGIIAPCATAPGEIVTNGWSPSKRNNPYANSGMVVAVNPQHFDPKNTKNPLAAMQYQGNVEKAAWKLGGGGQTAPAQGMIDFVHRKVSASLPKCSYLPGVRPAELRECLPPDIAYSLAEALKMFGNKMKGYFTDEAILVATESRTSSPVRIPRNDSYEHVEIKGIFPAGEGAGYAGGIVSAAMDGELVAQAAANAILQGTT